MGPQHSSRDGRQRLATCLGLGGCTVLVGLIHFTDCAGVVLDDQPGEFALDRASRSLPSLPASPLDDAARRPGHARRARPGRRRQGAALRRRASPGPSSSAPAIAPPPPLLDAGEHRSGGAVDLRGPASLLLGRDRQADLTLAMPGGPPPALATSSGSLGPPSPGADGRWHVQYTLPADNKPQLAFITATSRGADAEAPPVVEWIAIALAGQPRIELKSEPNMSVTVRVAGVLFGPARTDRLGHGHLVVSAPPGFTTGEMIARDDLGNEKTTLLQLGSPPLRRVLALCPPSGATRPLRVAALVAEASGRPATAAPIAFSASGGSVQPAKEIAPGLYLADLVPPQAEGTLTVTATLPASLPDPCSFELKTPPPTGLTVAFDRRSKVAGDTAVVRVRATVIGPGGGTVTLRADALSAAADLGSLSRFRSVGPGVFEGDWTLPDFYDGKHEATVTVKAADLQSIAAFPLEAGPATRLTLTAPPRPLRGEGRAVAQVPMRATDRFGNEALVPTLTFHADGKLSVAPDHTLRYRAPRTYTAVSDVVRVSSDNPALDAATSVTLRPLRFAVTAQVGYLTNFGKVSAPGAWLDIRYRLPWRRASLAVGGRIGVWASHTTEAIEAGAPIALSITEVPLLAHAFYYLPVRRVGVYLGAGGGVVLGSLTATGDTIGALAGRDTTGAASGLVGVELPLWLGRLGVEVGYLYSPVQQPVIRGNVGGLHMTAALGFDL